MVKHRDPENWPKCCICGKPKMGQIDGKYYCNKHWLRMRSHGTPDLVGRKTLNTIEEDGSIIRIKTTAGGTFIADKADRAKIERYSWSISKTGYPVANIRGKLTKLSRYLFDLKDPDLVVDHINNDPLDNRRENMRICKQKENARNKTGTGKVNGVGLTACGKYRARITINRREIWLGSFDTYDEAVRARLEGEKKYHGQYGHSFNTKEQILQELGEV